MTRRHHRLFKENIIEGSPYLKAHITKTKEINNQFNCETFIKMYNKGPIYFGNLLPHIKSNGHKKTAVTNQQNLDLNEAIVYLQKNEPIKGRNQLYSNESEDFVKEKDTMNVLIIRTFPPNRHHPILGRGFGQIEF